MLVGKNKKNDKKNYKIIIKKLYYKIKITKYIKENR